MSIEDHQHGDCEECDVDAGIITSLRGQVDFFAYEKSELVKKNWILKQMITAVM